MILMAFVTGEGTVFWPFRAGSGLSTNDAAAYDDWVRARNQWDYFYNRSRKLLAPGD